MEIKVEPNDGSEQIFAQEVLGSEGIDFPQEMPQPDGPQKVPQFKCEICNKSFLNNAQFRRHIRSHRPPEFACNVCPRAFNERHMLAKHCLRAHRQLPIFKCSTCPETFTDTLALRNHIVCVHNISGESFYCEECNKFFESRTQYTMHMRIHENLREGRYKCVPCQKDFSNSTNRNLHLQTYHGIDTNKSNFRKFSCQFCNKVFLSYTSHSDLEKHLKYDHKMSSDSAKLLMMLKDERKVKSPEQPVASNSVDNNEPAKRKRKSKSKKSTNCATSLKGTAQGAATGSESTYFSESILKEEVIIKDEVVIKDELDCPAEC